MDLTLGFEIGAEWTIMSLKTAHILSSSDSERTFLINLVPRAFLRRGEDGRSCRLKSPPHLPVFQFTVVHSLPR